MDKISAFIKETPKRAPSPLCQYEDREDGRLGTRMRAPQDTAACWCLDCALGLEQETPISCPFYALRRNVL